MNRKSGITLTSIIVYVILFFLLTSAITVLSTRLNKGLFNDRGMAINVNNVNKLEYNLLKSRDESDSANVDIDEANHTHTIVFSNSDTYVFNDETDTVKKNGGVICKNIGDFSVYPGKTYINVGFTLNKYLNDIDRTIKIEVPCNWYNSDNEILNLSAKENKGFSNYDDESNSWFDLSGTFGPLSLAQGSVSWYNESLRTFPMHYIFTKGEFDNSISVDNITIEINLHTLQQLGSGGSDYVYPFYLYSEDGTYTETLRFGFRRNCILMYGSGNNTVFSVATINLLQGQNNTITIVQESLTTRKAYVNGELILTRASLPLTSIQIKEIRLSRSNMGEYDINAYRVYTRALTAEEIAENYKLDLMRYGK